MNDSGEYNFDMSLFSLNNNEQQITEALKQSLDKESEWIYKTDEKESEPYEYLSEALDCAEFWQQTYAYVEVVCVRGTYYVSTGKPRSWGRVIKIYRNGYEYNVTTGKQL